MSMAVSEAAKGFTYSELRHYIVKRLQIAAPGKSMKQLLTTISNQDNVEQIVKELPQYKMILAKGSAGNGNKVKRKRHEKQDKDDDEEVEKETDDEVEKETEDEEDEEEDAMTMLKEELAIRGLTSKGNTYAFLVKRLIKSLRDED
mgnify:CR=1 FL=1|tara:strand:+ start:1572 stop:2009 length:438 start_codon:yes stop_codon:yes gene_type:complete